MSPDRDATLFVVIVLLAALLGGCGKKGPLYLPDAPRPSQSRMTE